MCLTINHFEKETGTLMDTIERNEFFTSTPSTLALSTDGKTIVVGYGTNSGRFLFFKYHDTEGWKLVLRKRGQFRDNVGYSVGVSLDGRTVSQGEPKLFNDNAPGYVNTYLWNEWIGSYWQVGLALSSSNDYDDFGRRISLSGNGRVLAVSADRYAGAAGRETGMATVFRLSFGMWFPMGRSIEGESQHALFGSSVALSQDGLVLAVGAEGANEVRVFRFDGYVWKQCGPTLHGEPGDVIGSVLTLSGDGTLILVGGYRNRTSITGLFRADFESEVK